METIWLIMLGVGVGVASLVGLVGVRKWVKGKQFREKVDATGKVVLISGANSGIGKQLAKEMNKRGAKVYMLCRSLQRGHEAAKELITEYNCDSSRLLVRELDLCSFASIRSFVQNFDGEEKKVDILLANAGVMLLPNFELTVDGHETTLQANHLGHFLLIELLMPKLERSEAARIVLTGSKLHTLADSCSIDKMNKKAEYGPLQSYARSKLASVLHAAELTKRLRQRNPNTKITVNSLHPGVVNTNLIRNPVYTKFLKYIFYPVLWYFTKTEEDGCQCTLFVALSQKINSISGKYFDNSTIITPHKLAKDENLCRQFYDESIRAVQLDTTHIKNLL